MYTTTEELVCTVLVYVFVEPEDRVVVVTVQDARSSTAVTTTRE